MKKRPRICGIYGWLSVAVTAPEENRLYGMDSSGCGAGFGRLTRQTSENRDPPT
jgi:hypothetical protein